MKKRNRSLGALLLALLLPLLTAPSAWADSPGVAFTRYKYGCFYISPGCCNTILAQDYDCLGRRIVQPSGRSCYNTGSGDWIIGTCGGGCVSGTCGGHPTKICVIDQPNIGCGSCDVFVEPLPGFPPANCTSQVDPACSKGSSCGTIGGWTCYTLPFDASEDLDSGYLCDQRTPQMMAAGCAPEALSSCLRINSLASDALSIDSSSGKRARLTGNVSAALGSSISWSLKVGGRLFSGSKDSLSEFWDGKGPGGKLVWPGSYAADLEVRVSGSSCRAREVRSLAVAVDARPESCGLRVNLGSSVHVGSGNLSHSQTLFELSPSQFPGAFALAYNSLSSQNDVLGLGWTHTYNLRLRLNNDGSYTLIQGDGSWMALYRQGDRYTLKTSPYPSLTLLPGGTATLEQRDGTLYSFSTAGQVTRIEDRNGNRMVFTYTAEKLTGIADPRGRRISLTYNARNRIEKVLDPNGNLHTFLYTGDDLTAVASEVSGLGTGTWTYSYYENSFLKTKADPLGNRTEYSYDGQYRLVQVIDPEGRKREVAYDPANSRTEVTEKDGGLWVYRYDSSLGVLVERTDPLENTTSYAYYPDRNLKRIKDPRGHTTSYAYDERGNVASVEDALGQITRYTYNAFNQVKTIELDPLEPQIAFSYDPRGNLTGAKDQMGVERGYGYDSRGNLVTIKNPLGEIGLEYDSRGYLVGVKNLLLGLSLFEFGYDLAGNRTFSKEAQGPEGVIRYEYDGLNRARKVTGPPPELNETILEYDFHGNLRRVVDGNGNPTSYEYNYRGQATRVTDALGYETDLRYGAACLACGSGGDRVTSVTDARKNATIFEYDLAGNLIKETSPMGYVTSYAYDPSGNLRSRRDANGFTTLYTFDGLNRLKEVQYPDMTRAVFSYDTRGNLKTAGNGNVSYTFSYDLSNRLIEARDSEGRTLNYWYDDLGRRTRMTTPDGRVVEYRYDSWSHLSQVLLDSVPHAEFSHDPYGRPMTLRYANGITTRYSYDPNGYLQGLTVQNPKGTTLQSLGYTHDRAGNRKTRTDLFGENRYDYDKTYQLTRAAHSLNPEETYAYDPAGNRLKTSVDLDNALLEDGEYLYGYDLSGNRTERTRKETGEKTRYVYDFENRLIRVESSGLVVEYKYDPFGRRVERRVNGEVRRYVYDGPHIVLEYDLEGGIKSRYLHGLGLDDVLILELGGRFYYYHKDGLGSVIFLTDESGQIAQSYEYDSFGRMVSRGGSVEQPFTFTGREVDSFPLGEVKTRIYYSSEVREGAEGSHRIGGGRIEGQAQVLEDLYYYRARYYDPYSGRFLTKDPIGFAGGDVNLYRYASNNPVDFIDPLGLKCKKSFGQRVWENFLITNVAIPGLLAPTGMGFLTGGATANALESVGPLRWALGGFRGVALGGTAFTGLETAAIAAGTAAVNFALVGLAWETGVGIGSVISAAILPCEEEKPACR